MVKNDNDTNFFELIKDLIGKLVLQQEKFEDSEKKINEKLDNHEKRLFQLEFFWKLLIAVFALVGSLLGFLADKLIKSFL